ncbi:MAG: zinc ribbon domain-containing protein [Deltaproteobacteria bacterium]|nr:zinc ribbon domain-containing protein [Deltaproteobacteria bacterium]
MPLYEYFCDSCRTSFEALVSSGASLHNLRACRNCGERSRRILSPVNFAIERRTPGLVAGRVHAKPDVTRLTLPPAARLCWMDNESAARLAAHKAGRGAEYDDTVAARKELASQSGESEVSKPAHSMHSHSPLSDPTVYANRRNAAQKEKVAESDTITKRGARKLG